jgi:hypothetical protein
MDLNLHSRIGLTPRLARSEAFAHIVDKIESEPIDQNPFPHVHIEDVFPTHYYQALLARIAAVGRFVPTLYPGVGVDLAAKSFRDYGLTCENFAADEELSELHGFLKSDQFSRLLLAKFSAPDSWGERGSAIPADKHSHFESGRDDFACVFDLHKDLPGYEITPHADHSSKIVTFLFYFTPDESMNRFGTMLCRMKSDARAEATPPSRSVLSKLVLRVSRAFIGENYGLAQKDAWLPWERFEVVKTAQAKPNSLLVFAPNSHSFHSVRMDIPPDHPLQERQTLRGFIRGGKNSSNYKVGYSRGLGRKLVFGVARRLSPLRKAFR